MDKLKQLESRIEELEKQNINKNKLIFLMFIVFLTLSLSALWLGYNNIIAITSIINSN